MWLAIGHGSVDAPMYILIMPPFKEILRHRVEPASGPTAALGAVTQFGHQAKHGEWMRRDRVFGRFALVYLLEGAGRYVDEAHDQTVAAGDLILVWPDRPHRYGPGTGRWQEMYLVFEGPGFAPWDHPTLLDRRQPVIHLRPVSLWSRRIAAVVQGDAATAPAALGDTLRLLQLLGQVVAARDAAASADPDEPLGRARELIEQQAHQLLDLPAIAESVDMSYPTFRRRFAEAFGQAPGQYRTEQVMQRARAMMIETDHTDARIAADLGFSDPFHFSKRFKQCTGQTPTQYRASLRRP